MPKDPTFQQLVDRIADSAFFDPLFYAEQTGVRRMEAEAIAHYLDEGEQAGLRPTREFDPQFYLRVHADVRKAGGGALAHYIEFGAAERRYVNQQNLSADAARVMTSGLLGNEEKNNAQLASSTDGITNLEARLAGRPWFDLLESFDEKAYAGLYPDVAQSGLHPIVHYAEIGRFEGRVSPGFRNADYDALKPVFDEDFYRSRRRISPDDDALEDYFRFGRWQGYPAAPDFQQDYYLARYPDINAAAYEPYLHFLRHGREENRIGRANFSDRIKDGELRFDATRETVLVASHEASRTGAPLVALAVGQYLSDKYNVIFAVGRHGVIEDAFLQSSVAIVQGVVDGPDAPFLLRRLKQDYNLSLALLNSVETFQLAEGALLADIASVGLIHEFAEYSAGRIGRMVASVDVGILPAQLLLDSAQEEMTRDFSGEANNLTVRPQGFLPTLPEDSDNDDLTAEEILASLSADRSPRPRIILGAGFVHIRKGLDWFLQAAAALSAFTDEDYRFVWVGHGYDPHRDHFYSLWIKDMIKRLGLEEKMFFFEPQSSLDAFFELADVFFLSSRLDPFPNVVLDAFEAGTPVVCFRRATGCAEWFDAGKAVGAAVDYGDVQAAAKAIAGLLAGGSDIGRRNVTLAQTDFDFARYGAFIEQQFDVAKRRRAEQVEAFERLEQTSAFDSAFNEAKVNAGSVSKDGLKHYVARAYKGLSRTNARPGFSDNLYRSQSGLEPEDRVVPLDHAIRTTGNPRPTTHRCVMLKPGEAVTPYTGRIAVHLHLHYSQLAFEFSALLNDLGHEIDVFVTTGAGKRMSEVRYAFEKYRKGAVEIMEAPNRGRDIGPFMTLLGDRVDAGGYDLVGHFHGKKSMAVEGAVPGLGDRWRQFLVQTLMGSSRRELGQVLGLFAESPQLGLVFAEDRNAVGWAKNRDIADDLAARLRPRPVLPSQPFYPLGNMFWSRPAAVKPLWDLGLDWSDYPSEPLPYDGSILHAVERMLPSICEATGHDWLTVYRPGKVW